MLKVNSTEVQNNFGKYLLLAGEQDVIITRNGQEVARLTGLKPKPTNGEVLAEEALAKGYGLRHASYEEFLALTKDSNERYEFIDGEIFLQASPKVDHQLVLSELHGILHMHFSPTSCHVFTAPFDIQIRSGEKDIHVVQPDLLVICDLEDNLGADGYYKGVPGLVIEILSDGTRRNDLLKKLNLYLQGGVKEYWVVDPDVKQVICYSFQNQDIVSQIAYGMGEEASSFLFPDLKVDLSAVFRVTIRP